MVLCLVAMRNRLQDPQLKYIAQIRLREIRTPTLCPGNGLRSLLLTGRIHSPNSPVGRMIFPAMQRPSGFRELARQAIRRVLAMPHALYNTINNTVWKCSACLCSGLFGGLFFSAPSCNYCRPASYKWCDAWLRVRNSCGWMGSVVYAIPFGQSRAKGQAGG